jgi:hypothetical protein
MFTATVRRKKWVWWVLKANRALKVSGKQALTLADDEKLLILEYQTTLLTEGNL